MSTINKISVVLFTYRKIQHLPKILNAINNYVPKKLFIFHNSYFSDTDKSDVEEVKLFLTNIKLNYPFQIIYQPIHYKINDQIKYGLDYAFQDENELIILEDDIIPSAGFFYFFEQMLFKYQNDTHIGCINGCNLDAVNENNTFFTSKISAPFWGWATWRNRWEKYDDSSNIWKRRMNRIRMLYGISFQNRRKFKQLFNQTSEDASFLTWDFLWQFMLLDKNLYSIISSVNLVTNAGFSINGTCTNYTKSQFKKLDRNSNYEPKELTLSQYNKTHRFSYEIKVIELVKEITENQNKRMYERFKNDVTIQ